MGHTTTLSSRDTASAWWNETIIQSVAYLKACASTVVDDIDVEDPAALIAQIAGEHNLVLSAYWTGRSEERMSGYRALYRSEDKKTVVLMDASDTFNVDAWGEDNEKLRALTEAVAKRVPQKKTEGDDDTIIPCAFWFQSMGGAKAEFRDITCPKWADIKINYTPAVQTAMEQLLEMKRPDECGKIILWHGPPGTGKTHLILALAHEWSQRMRTNVELVLDYTQLFASADYMYSVLVAEGVADRVAHRIARRLGRFDNDDSDKGNPLRLMIVEDGAPLFGKSNRDSEGFSRFLNMTDGIVGQGLRMVFIISGNEKIEQIDPAVHRAGRCLQEVFFDHLDPASAQQWLAAKGRHDLTPLSKTSLADLYGMLQQRQPTRSTGARATVEV